MCPDFCKPSSRPFTLRGAVAGPSASCSVSQTVRNTLAASLSGRDRKHIDKDGIAGRFNPRGFSTQVERLAEKLARPL